MKINRRQLRNLLLREAKQLLREGDPEYAAAQGALEALREMVDVTLGSKIRDPDQFSDPRNPVIAIINACVKDKLISTQEAAQLRSDHDLDVDRED